MKRGAACDDLNTNTQGLDYSATSTNQSSLDNGQTLRSVDNNV